MSLSSVIYDVIVVGAGPGGSAAAKKCAEHGCKVLLLEKRKRPRHKVCSGWLMDNFTRNLVDRVFGAVPLQVLNNPPYLSGFVVHGPGGKREIVRGEFPQAWRKDLDYWMNEKASEAGVEIWDESRVIGVIEDDEKCSVRLVRNETEQEISARYVIGCDGCQSAVRKSLFPDLRSHSMQSVQHWYKGSLGDLEREYLHEFLYPDAKYDTRSVAPGSICGVHYKEDYFCISCGAIPGQWRENMQKARDLLSEFYGFDSGREPLWIDSCIVPELHSSLIDGSLRPAKGNILLVGDAAGLMDTREGGNIGLAIRTGEVAADCIVKSEQRGDKAESHYLQAWKSTLSIVNRMHRAIE
ncbi:MAG: NAD(P)/FAD-dependent oxidoreductase [Chloroflexi bacterium]|nr:NAD(P)/FAD-dependent oxidoreductase [Chloroflexota bacterium]